METNDAYLIFLIALLIVLTVVAVLAIWFYREKKASAKHLKELRDELSHLDD
jgi:hypothetical protein